MSWKERASKIQIGDRVCFHRNFLRNTGQMTGDVPQARGTVTDLISFGELVVAQIKWDIEDLPGRVVVQNLARITQRGIDEEY